MVSFLSKSIFQNEITNHKSKIQKKIFFYISDLHFYFHFKEKVHEFECLENDVDRRVMGKKVNSSVSLKMYPPASKASREIANLTERKIHIPLNMVSKILSVCGISDHSILPVLDNWGQLLCCIILFLF